MALHKAYFIILIVFLLVSVSTKSFAQEVQGSPVPLMANKLVTSTPRGARAYCKLHSEQCAPSKVRSIIWKTPERMRQLLSALRVVRNSIRYESEPLGQDIWQWRPSYGDCEDYALEIRRMLLERGWTADMLLITIVYTENDIAHAVLLVPFADGDVFVDQRLYAPADEWWLYKYKWIKRQSRASPRIWVPLQDYGYRPQKMM